MATAAQIRDTAAENLGKLGEGQTMSAYMTDDLTQAAAEVYAELQALGLTTWDETSDVPDQYAQSFAMLVAEARAVKYKIPDAQYQRIKLEGWGANEDGIAIRKIRRLQARSKQGQTQIENF